jgi:hypothetical protein
VTTTATIYVVETKSAANLLQSVRLPLGRPHYSHGLRALMTVLELEVAAARNLLSPLPAAA